MKHRYNIYIDVMIQHTHTTHQRVDVEVANFAHQQQNHTQIMQNINQVNNI